jgi:hypothetical protein
MVGSSPLVILVLSDPTRRHIMTSKSNIATKPDFVRTLVGLVAGVLILVATAGFVFIPYSLSGHPGELMLGAVHTSAFHLT